MLYIRNSCGYNYPLFKVWFSTTNLMTILPLLSKLLFQIVMMLKIVALGNWLSRFHIYPSIDCDKGSRGAYRVRHWPIWPVGSWPHMWSISRPLLAGTLGWNTSLLNRTDGHDRCCWMVMAHIWFNKAHGSLVIICIPQPSGLKGNPLDLCS